MEGVLLIDKPAGWTSNDVVTWVRRQVSPGRRRRRGRIKVGHTGTLDPFATGLLVLVLGQATKLVPVLMDLPKRYRAVLQLGRATTTLDPEGDVSQELPVPPLDADTIAAAMASFIGEIEQVPPMFSALRQGGKRLYELAREGIEVERQARRVTIYDLHLVEYDERRSHLAFDVTCSKGTYVRTLGADVAHRLGTCGSLHSLRRTAIGAFRVEEALELESLIEEKHSRERVAAHLADRLVCIERAVAHLPRAELSDGEAQRVRQGQPVAGPHIDVDGPADAGLVRLLDADQKLVALAVQRDGAFAPLRVFH